MSLFHRFDLSSEFTIFYLVLFLILMAVTISLSMVSSGKRQRNRGGGKKVDDRFIDRTGELID